MTALLSIEINALLQSDLVPQLMRRCLEKGFQADTWQEFPVLTLLGARRPNALSQSFDVSEGSCPAGRRAKKPSRTCKSAVESLATPLAGRAIDRWGFPE